jgi:hypothetical protein
MLSDISVSDPLVSDTPIRVLQGSTQVTLAELTFPEDSVDEAYIYEDFPLRPGVLDEDWIELHMLQNMADPYRIDAAVYILRLGNPAPITVPVDGPVIPPPE